MFLAVNLWHSHTVTRSCQRVIAQSLAGHSRSSQHNNVLRTNQVYDCSVSGLLRPCSANCDRGATVSPFVLSLLTGRIFYTLNRIVREQQGHCSMSYADRSVVDTTDRTRNVVSSNFSTRMSHTSCVALACSFASWSLIAFCFSHRQSHTIR